MFEYGRTIQKRTSTFEWMLDDIRTEKSKKENARKPCFGPDFNLLVPNLATIFFRSFSSTRCLTFVPSCNPVQHQRKLMMQV